MRVTRTQTPPLALVLFLWAGSAYTETATEPSSGSFYNLSLAELGQVEISIATGNSTPLDRAPATATVISAGEIQAMGARNLNEVLETVPGLHVSLSSLSRLDSVYSIRGIHTGFNPQVLLMLNGIPVQYSIQGGRPTLFRLPTTSIDRVEVIRGPGSAIYGADAYSGVINVITKDASSMVGTQSGGGIGSFGTRDLWLQSALEWQDLGVAFSMSYQESQGDDKRRVASDLQSLFDSLLGTDVSNAPSALATRYRLLDTHLAVTGNQVQLNLWNWRLYDAGVGAGGAQVLDPIGRDDSNLWLGDVTYRFDTDTSVWDNSVRLSYMKYEQSSYFVLFPAGTKLFVGADGNINFTPAEIVGQVTFIDGYIGQPSALAEDTQLDLVSIYKGWDNHRLRFAVGARYQSVAPEERKNFGPGVIDGSELIVGGSLIDVSSTPNAFLVDSARSIRYLSLQDEWQLANNWQLTAGVRHDDYSDFGTTTNPRVALVWATTDYLTTKLLYGSAFRAPSFTEQFGKNNPVVLGNPNLDPEKMGTTEISFAYRLSANLKTGFTLFDYHSRDMIEFVQDASATTRTAARTAANARDQDGQGFELEIDWKPLPQFYVAASYALQDARDSRTNNRIADAPGEQAKLALDWEFYPDWFLHHQLHWIGDRRRALAPAADLQRSEIDDYALLNLTIRHENLLPNLDASLAVRNLTDADAREPSTGAIAQDYPLESRSFWMDLHYSFK